MVPNERLSARLDNTNAWKFGKMSFCGRPVMLVMGSTGFSTRIVQKYTLLAVIQHRKDCLLPHRS